MSSTPLKRGKNGTRSVNKHLSNLLGPGNNLATVTVAGIVKRGTSVANAVGAAPTKAEFNALLASLRTAGILAS